jgi:hypothetical protein
VKLRKIFFVFTHVIVILGLVLSPLQPAVALAASNNPDRSLPTPAVSSVPASATSTGIPDIQILDTATTQLQETSLLLPNLVPTDFTAPPSAASGDTIEISWNVQNQGTGEASGYWTDSIYLSRDAFPDDADLRPSNAEAGWSGSLMPGAVYTQSSVWITLPKISAGTYYLILRVDRGNSVQEITASDNWLAIPFTITNPNLVPLSLDVPASGTAGDQIDITYTAQNQGAGSAVPYRAAQPGTARFRRAIATPNLASHAYQICFQEIITSSCASIPRRSSMKAAWPITRWLSLLPCIQWICSRPP